jgi:hypothetical protein
MAAGFSAEMWQHSRLITSAFSVYVMQQQSERNKALVDEVFALRLAIAALPGADEQTVDTRELIRRKLVPPQLLQNGHLFNRFAGEWKLGGTKAAPVITATVIPQDACVALASLDIFSEIRVNDQPIGGRGVAAAAASCASPQSTVALAY